MKEVMVSYGVDVRDCMLYKQTQNTVSCILSDSVKNFCYFIFVFPHLRSRAARKEHYNSVSSFM